MKLNVKRTILIGFAFLSISAFWQMYDGLIPLILTNTFGIPKTASGSIMAIDNVLALFLLPLFGGISDKCKSKLGRRRPFILFGTLISVVLMMALPIINDSYLSVPSTFKFVSFVVVLGLLLVAMGTYRSPAVALMPDVTPKPLRSKGNAVINLMGAVGGVLYLIITTFIYSTKEKNVSYVPIFAIVAGIMLIALFIIMVFVNEPKLMKEQAEYEKNHPQEELTVSTDGDKKVMPKDVKRSLIFMLLSISFWFIGYNAISTWFTTYAQNVWGMSLGSANLCLTVGTVVAIISYIPVGAIASKVGRKKTIIFGVILLASSFFAGFVYTLLSDHFLYILYLLFACVGIGWASINVNSLPMVVEMCSGADVGKFTGLYYTFSMSAQTITPILAGFLLDVIGYKALFPYATVFVALAIVSMSLVKHGDNKIERKKGLDAFDMDD